MKNEILIDIERSIIKKYRKELWAKFVRAIDNYKLLSEGDSICVCISGGKDSFLLAKLFQELKRHSDISFDVKYIVMNPGYKTKDLEKIKNNLLLLGIDATIYDTNIFSVVDSVDKNKCYLCARMRRGHLYKIAQSIGCYKIALGHHFDDVIETTLMNMLNSGSFQTMLPKLHSTNFKGLELIRPMYLIREEDINRFVKYNNLDFIRCACSITEGVVNKQENSQRAKTKELIHSLLDYNKLVEYNIFKSAENVNVNMLLGYQIDGIDKSFLDDYDNNVANNEIKNEGDL